MSNLPFVADGPMIDGHPPYDRSPRQAWAEMPEAVRAAWRERYLTEAAAELRVLALLERTEAGLRTGGTPVTIRMLWIALADRAGSSDDAGLRGAAALAGMAMGLQPS